MTMIHPNHTPIPTGTPTASGVSDSANDDAAYLGPGRVLAIGAGKVSVELDDTQTKVEVTPAFTFPYRVQPEDRLLILGQAGTYYAVGVLCGSGPAALHFSGDVSMHAVNGKLTLGSDRAIEIEAPRVTVRAGILRTISDHLVENYGNVRRWVRGLMTIRAGRSRRVIDGDDSTRCKNSTTLAKDTVTIDGDQLHLGH